MTSAQVVAELVLQPLEVLDHAVVGEQPAALLERVRVARLDPAGRGVADVGDERPSTRAPAPRERTPGPRRRPAAAWRRSGRPSAPNQPSPVPSGSRRLCAARLSGASSSQNVALTRWAPRSSRTAGTRTPACHPVEPLAPAMWFRRLDRLDARLGATGVLAWRSAGTRGRACPRGRDRVPRASRWALVAAAGGSIAVRRVGAIQWAARRCARRTR